jgi:hypothetical protein
MPTKAQPIVTTLGLEGCNALAHLVQPHGAVEDVRAHRHATCVTHRAVDRDAALVDPRLDDACDAVAVELAHRRLKEAGLLGRRWRRRSHAPNEVGGILEQDPSRFAGGGIAHDDAAGRIWCVAGDAGHFQRTGVRCYDVATRGIRTG